jgi:phosphoserine aminotransferase
LAHVAANGKTDQGVTHVPPLSEWHLSNDPTYIHLCRNETIDGVEMFATHDVGDMPLAADVSSHILSRPMNVARYGVLYAGAQRNIGMAGLTIM